MGAAVGTLIYNWDDAPPTRVDTEVTVGEMFITETGYGVPVSRMRGERADVTIWIDDKGIYVEPSK